MVITIDPPGLITEGEQYTMKLATFAAVGIIHVTVCLTGAAANPFPGKIFDRVRSAEPAQVTIMFVAK